jgi:acyl carrier protein
MDTYLARLNEVFQEVFADSELMVTRQTTTKDIEGWDSVMHVTLLVSVERAFGIRFRTSEVAGLKHVGELVDRIVACLARDTRTNPTN